MTMKVFGAVVRSVLGTFHCNCLTAEGLEIKLILRQKRLHSNFSKFKKSVRLFVCSFVCLFVCSFVRLFVCSFVCLFVCSFVRLFVCSFVCFFVRLFVCSFVCSFVCLFVCLFARLFVFLYLCTFVCMYEYLSFRICVYLHVCLALKLYRLEVTIVRFILFCMVFVSACTSVFICFFVTPHPLMSLLVCSFPSWFISCRLLQLPSSINHNPPTLQSQCFSNF